MVFLTLPKEDLFFDPVGVAAVGAGGVDLLGVFWALAGVCLGAPFVGVGVAFVGGGFSFVGVGLGVGVTGSGADLRPLLAGGGVSAMEATSGSGSIDERPLFDPFAGVLPRIF